MNRSELAVIGGTGLTQLPGLEIQSEQVVETPFGAPSSPLFHGVYKDRRVSFLSRHGVGHTIAPHRINYRANLWALREHTGGRILSVAAVGGINGDLSAGGLCVPDQIIDYTWGRAQTFFEEDLDEVVHVDFTQPYCESLRSLLLEVAGELGIDVMTRGTYGAVQGPRLESAAEVDRLERDGCDIVGMTGMPEAGLARELDLCYATCAVCANAAAGRGAGRITMEDIRRTLRTGMAQVASILEGVLSRL